MKQLIQSFKTGELGLFNVPAPVCEKNGALVQTTVSLVSAGTEKMLVDFAKKSMLAKAKDRPDLVKQVIDKMKKEGVRNTLEKVFTKLDTPIPLGYSLSGRVVQVGDELSGINIGDRVACGGAGYANHAEINYVPKNLMVKIPDGVDDIDASFVTVGAIALQGVRQTAPLLGEKIAVMGLGLLGQLTVQLLKANGCKVIGSDIDPDKMALAKKLGCDEVCHAGELISKANEFTCGYGVDAVIIAASTSSNQPITDAAEISRMRGRVVLVGMVGMDVPRNTYYKKELEIKLSMAYGPGRYDPEYEEKGIDYPYDLVRFTEQRNFEAFLGLIAEGKITPKELITHFYNFDDAMSAYDLLEGRIQEKYLGIVLNYKKNINLEDEKIVQRTEKKISSEKVNVGLIGAGNFTKSVILPNIQKVGEYELVGLCTATGVSAQGTGKKYDFKYITTDSDEIFKNSEINSVFVTTRHNDHSKKVLKAIESKKHCFVEKPLCIYEEELEAIKEAYTGETLVQVGFNRRYSPMIEKMKKSINGQISVNYRVNAGIIPKNVWIQDKTIGGGRIIGEVCHFIDTCSYLIESDVVSVFASTVNKADQSIPDEDNVNIILNYTNGSTATISYMAFGDSSMPKEYIEVFGSGVSMQMNDFRELTIFKKGKISKEKSANQDKGFVNEFKAFKEAVKSGNEAISFESIYNTTKTTFKILESIRSKSLVEV
ncbi:medium chain dehydrogenase/reductase (MDR) / zinc-dependent alcohol dehydrogenase-like family protein [Arcobacter venerupis]|uniref:Medium chain dehydrogenase/reductase (MDR) / zinc-dependent alcohol dehydrogenase-like family protein n=1 Tax=Arcobacter venerupis TaxID=1054033 RepID=A0AAE7B6Z2_9BACT|nr:bi-domain-containing oxidoreductase [Arcobacter venerupis]QKF66498.1 medium chain dehydrogenase/reductase (MDR) / zinc-dependent alcohol dehydrogenase-like family protein [Arcobacter venerupis]RWS48236.1 oxidoreductase [Arcobacter venerupis]